MISPHYWDRLPDCRIAFPAAPLAGPLRWSGCLREETEAITSNPDDTFDNGQLLLLLHLWIRQTMSYAVIVQLYPYRIVMHT